MHENLSNNYVHRSGQMLPPILLLNDCKGVWYVLGTCIRQSARGSAFKSVGLDTKPITKKSVVVEFFFWFLEWSQ